MSDVMHRFVPGEVYNITLAVDGARVELTARLAGVRMESNGGPEILLEAAPGTEIALWTEAGDNLQVEKVHPSSEGGSAT